MHASYHNNPVANKTVVNYSSSPIRFANPGSNKHTPPSACRKPIVDVSVGSRYATLSITPIPNAMQKEQAAGLFLKIPSTFAMMVLPYFHHASTKAI